MLLIDRALGAEYHGDHWSWGDAPGWDDAGALSLNNGFGALRPNHLQRQRRIPSQPGATPQDTVRKSHQGLKARSIMPRDRSSATLLIDRAVGAEYRLESISWGDAPGWDDTEALPLKNETGALPLKNDTGALPLKNDTGASPLKSRAEAFLLKNDVLVLAL